MIVDKVALSTAEIINSTYKRKNETKEGPFTINQQTREVTLNQCLRDLLTLDFARDTIDKNQRNLLEFLGTLDLDNPYQIFFEKFVDGKDLPKFKELCALGHQLLLQKFEDIRKKFSPAVQKQSGPTEEEVDEFKVNFYRALTEIQARGDTDGFITAVASITADPMYESIPADDRQEINHVIRQEYQKMDAENQQTFDFTVSNSASILEEPSTGPRP